MRINLFKKWRYLSDFDALFNEIDVLVLHISGFDGLAEQGLVEGLTELQRHGLVLGDAERKVAPRGFIEHLQAAKFK